MAEKMVLVDGNSLMHRAFHALPTLTTDAGVHTNALNGFFMMLLKVLESEAPAYCAVAFDLPGKTFRHEKFDEYKAGRTPTPDELREQFDLLRSILAKMHMAILELPGYEADDLLGTMSRICEEQGIDALLVTGDRDTFQLAGAHTSIIYTKTGISDIERITPKAVEEKYGVTPAQFIDLKGLMGDKSDNIPGVPGVGEKTARNLLAQYASLERALDCAQTDLKGKLRERLGQYREQAILSKWLATIDRHAPLTQDPRACRLDGLLEGLSALRALQMNRVSERLRQYCAAREALKAPERADKAPEGAAEGELFERLEDFAARMRVVRADVVALLMGTHLSLATDGGACYSIRLGGDLIEPGVSEQEALKAAQPALDTANTCLVYDAKHLLALGVRLRPDATFDVKLAAYVLDAHRRGLALADLFADAGLAPAEHAPAKALVPLARAQREALQKDGVWALFEQVEMPLAFLLHEMEQVGFLTDERALSQLGAEYAAQIETLTGQIEAVAGGAININSPKQLGVLLFDTLGLPGGKRTKTGHSTSADVLEKLRDQHPVVDMILTYRKYAKLKSTYVDALLRLRGADGRIHTSFDQTSTVTGRISSLEPNLQNIPVRTELGRDIRRAFVAPLGSVLVDADYSQIELRVLAHMSGDRVMREAFLEGQDIHARTAAEVYGVPLASVTQKMRSDAKAVNFGIVYGISDFGLARNIGVSRAEAAAFIETYFARYPDVKRFMNGCVLLGKTQGYVSTLFGRRRYLPELSDRNRTVAQFGERAAMNSPIQGTAADIIKKAMIAVARAMRAQGLRAKLILQVHDELIVEAPEAEREAVGRLLVACMEGVVSLDVPLKAEVQFGKSWYESK